MQHVCRGYLRAAHPGINVEAYATKLSRDESEYEKHIDGVEAYEDVQNGEKPRVYRKRKRGDDDLADQEEEVITCKQSRQLEAKRCLGILWPVNVFKQVENRSPKVVPCSCVVAGGYSRRHRKSYINNHWVAMCRGVAAQALDRHRTNCCPPPPPRCPAQASELTRMNIGGENLTGVLRDVAFGNPVGIVQIFENTFSDISKRMDIHKSSEALRDGQTDVVWRYASGKMKADVSVKADENGGETVVTCKVGGGKKRQDDFDDICDFPTVQSQASGSGGKKGDGGQDADDEDMGSESDGEGGNKKKRNNRKAARTKPAVPRVKAKSHSDSSVRTPPSSDKRRPNTAKVTKEVSAAETVVLQYTQFVRDLQCKETVVKISESRLDTLEAKVKQRLSPDLVKVYSADFDVVEDSAAESSLGMVVLEGLRVAAKVLAQVRPFIQASTATSGPLSSGKELRSAMEKAQEGGLVKLPAGLTEVVLARELASTLAEKDYVAYAAILTPPTGPADLNQEPAISLSCLPEAARPAFQSRHLLKALAEFCRADGNIPECLAYDAAIKDVKLLQDCEGYAQMCRGILRVGGK